MLESAGDSTPLRCRQAANAGIIDGPGPLQESCVQWRALWITYLTQSAMQVTEGRGTIDFDASFSTPAIIRDRALAQDASFQQRRP
jgi:hypothetical protein